MGHCTGFSRISSDKGFLLIQNSIRSPYFQLAWEEAIALSMPSLCFKYGVRIWKCQKTIVLGISEKESMTIHADILRKFQNFYPSFLQSKNIFKTTKDTQESTIWIARRASGGGTVFQSVPENINFSLFCDISEKRQLYPIRHSYEILLGIVRKALQKLGIFPVCAGTSDISIFTNSPNGSFNLKKISGNAQFRKGNILVQHGTLILDSKIISEIEKYQLHPPTEPDYRKHRSHIEFLTSFPGSFDAETFGLSLFEELSCYMEGNAINETYLKGDSLQIKSLLRKSLEKARQLCMEKYSQPKWIFKG